MAKHSSVVGGSSAERVMNCPSSVELAKRLPPPPTSEFANEGTALHDAIAAILDLDFKEDKGVIGATYSGVEITEDLFNEALKPSLGFFDQLTEEFKDPEFSVEQRVAFDGIEGAFGTADIIMKAPDRSIVLDWKFGKGVRVSAENNAQLMFYAFAGMMTKETADLFGPDDDWPVELIIAQPRIENGFSRWLTTQRQLKAYARELRHAVSLVGTEQAEFKMGKWCKFCPAKPECPLMLNQVDKALETPLEGLEECLADWLEAIPRLKEWIAAVEAMSHDRAEAGHKIPGYKLVAGRTTRKFKDEDAAVKVLRRLGLKAADMYIKKFVSPAQAEKALKAIDKAFTDKQIEELIEKHTSGTSLVPEEDSRPAVELPMQSLQRLGRRLSAL